jgi:hypothetical protein
VLVSDDSGSAAAAADGDETAKKPVAAATRERRALQARAMRCVALAVPAGANVVVDGDAPLTDVDLAVRALELDPLSCEGWFALGVVPMTCLPHAAVYGL